VLILFLTQKGQTSAEDSFILAICACCRSEKFHPKNPPKILGLGPRSWIRSPLKSAWLGP